jgi:hypothetical protein
VIPLFTLNLVEKEEGGGEMASNRDETTEGWEMVSKKWRATATARAYLASNQFFFAD